MPSSRARKAWSGRSSCGSGSRTIRTTSEALPGIRRYRQNHAIEHHKPWPFDGAAELWFDSLKDIAVAFASPAGDAMREHEEEFIGTLQWFIADELEIDLSGATA